MALSFAHAHNAQVLRELDVGDVVEFPRSDFYSHWGLYLGDEKIVHVTGNGGLFSVSGIGFGEQAFVKIENFWRVANGCKAKVNNIQDHNRSPRHSSEIVKEAYAMVGKAAFNVLWNNCEHFASYLRYGEKSSNQGTMAAMVIGGAAVAVGGLLGGVMAGALFLSMKRNRDKEDKRNIHDH